MEPLILLSLLDKGPLAFYYLDEAHVLHENFSDNS